MNSFWWRIAWLGILPMVLLMSCRSKRDVAVRDFPAKSTQELVDWIQQGAAEYESFNAKVSADVRAEGRNNSFRATLRIRRDSAIWVSVSPALGIEVFRLLCTQDSVKYIDKIKNKYFIGTYQKLNELTNSDLSLAGLEDILVGNPLYFLPELRYRSRNDDLGYMLATRNANRIRRAVGMGGQEALELPLDTTGESQIERRIMRLQDRLDEDDLIARQYWLHHETGKVVQTVFTDLLSEIFLRAFYSDHEEVSGQLFPGRIDLTLGNTQEQATFRLSYSRMRINEPVSMPFSIPDKYEQVVN